MGVKWPSLVFLALVIGLPLRSIIKWGFLHFFISLKGIFSIHHQNHEVLLHTHSDDADITAEVCGSVCSVLGLSPLCVWHFIKTFFRQTHPLHTTVQKMWDRSEQIRSFHNASDYSWKIRAAETTGGFQSLLLFLFSFCKQQIVIMDWNEACSGGLKQIPLVKMSCRVFLKLS